MTTKTEESNKALVPQAFDTLFIKRLRDGALGGLLIAFAVSLLSLQGCTQVVKSDHLQ